MKNRDIKHIPKGLLLIVSGPSGAGKGTLVKAICEENSNIQLSVSVTTRSPREGEMEGKSYFFKGRQEFENMIQNDEFMEWVNYCDNYYGTPKKHVEEVINEGRDVLLEIEIVGALKIKEKYPESILLFILPPSFEELRNRIEGRHSETSETMQKRLDKAKEEIKYLDKYDYFVINDDISKAIGDINSILISERLKVDRNKEYIYKVTNIYKEG